MKGTECGGTGEMVWGVEGDRGEVGRVSQGHPSAQSPEIKEGTTPHAGKGWPVTQEGDAGEGGLGSVERVSRRGPAMMASILGQDEGWDWATGLGHHLWP